MLNVVVVALLSQPKSSTVSRVAFSRPQRNVREKGERVALIPHSATSVAPPLLELMAKIRQPQRNQKRQQVVAGWRPRPKLLIAAYCRFSASFTDS